MHFLQGLTQLDSYYPPNTPIVSLGYSLGCCYAYDLAKSLIAQGRNVLQMVLLGGICRRHLTKTSALELRPDLKYEFQEISEVYGEMPPAIFATVSNLSPSAMEEMSRVNKECTYHVCFNSLKCVPCML